MIALLRARQEGRLGAGSLQRNLVAGLVVGVVALPLAMAFAIASGARPEQGIYSAIVAGICVSLFGGSQVQIAGPTGAFIVLLAEITRQHGLSGLSTATFLAGLILIALGTVRLGQLVRFLPTSVILGFTAGIAVVIALGQCTAFLGLPELTGEHAGAKMLSLTGQLVHLDLQTTLVGVTSLATLLLCGHGKLARIPGPLAALCLGTAVQAAFGFTDVATIGSAFGGIPTGLPALQFPDLSPGRMVELLGPAFAIASLGAVESLLSAVVADGMLGSRHDSDQELVGQGLANVVAPFFGGFAVTGALARTATSVRYGGNSPLAGLIHCLLLTLVLLFLAPLAKSVPLATLAAILLVVAWNMSELPQILAFLRSSPRAENLILLCTFLLTVFTDLILAVQVGMALAAIDFLRKMAGTVQLSRHDLQATVPDALPAGVVAYTVDGPYFFAAAERFEHALSEIQAEAKVLILVFRWVPFIDSTGLLSLGRLAERLKKKGTRLVLAGVTERAQGELMRAGLIERLGWENVHSSLDGALEAILASDGLAPRNNS
ncbi:MAG: STAS domain-containing protein [Candidatus Eremiobacteraeota bacterium]|nr:STAS domain-containing protein [Candidatus Eremiobacteraeota bacterium]MCW5870725.1 STAS domain-containing protein [Candidatus Eremiobacteraeota bacterium]